MDEIFGIFPVPILRAPRAVPRALADTLAEHFGVLAEEDNNVSPSLTHTRMLRPCDSPLLSEVAALVSPKLVEFGVHLFGERQAWAVKELWVNVMDYGGYQAMHNHANSFVSGILYLTSVHASARTVFMKSPGGIEFSFKNDHSGVATGPFNAEKWISPAPEPGDLLLFPSYLLHAVPHNAGQRRISLALNAIPARLDSWGYAIHFSG